MSPLLAPALREIERAVDALLQKNAEARILGMRSPVRRAWPELIERQGKKFRLAWCASELEVREQLDDAEEEGAERVVVLTPLDVATLGDDVVARFPRARLEQSDRWTALRTAFQVRDVDSRLRGERWLADLLVERVPATGYAPAASGILDLETAWRAALQQILGIPEARADIAALLLWSLNPTGPDRLVHLPDDARQAIANRVTETGGAAATLVLRAVIGGRASDALPVALVCGVVFGEVPPRPELRDAAVRLEPFVGGVKIAPAVGQALAEAGRRMLVRLMASDEASDVAAGRAAQARASAMLEEVRASDAAALSPALDIGLDARIRDAATALDMAAASGSIDDANRAWRLAQLAAQHDRASGYRARLNRLIMAARLCNWLAGTRPAAPKVMAEAASSYASDSGFVDRARNALRGGDALPEVSAAYARLRDVATDRREKENEAFALLLRGWSPADSRIDEPIPVERLLDTLLSRLPQETPILVLVLDGLSFPVWREIAENITGTGWVEICPMGDNAPLVAVAALPSKTEVSRTSLLCGTLSLGDQGTERAGFSAHRQLRQRSRAAMPPRLFHKADLGAGPELDAPIREAISDPQQRIVGVVHNAVDAQLGGSDQLDLNWSAEGLRQLMALLQAARAGGRLTIVTGDHGHVVEAGTVQKPGGSGDRWRAGAGPANEGEVVVSGSRVLSPAGGHTLVAAWSERIRYAAKQGGYHGGASPQEMLIPVAILAYGTPPNGFDEMPLTTPAWWRGVMDEPHLALAARQAAPPPANTSRRQPAASLQPQLFAEVAQQALEEVRSDPTRLAAAPTTVLAPAWIDQLIQCEAYSAQRRLAGRGAPADDQVRTLLVALALRGGRATHASLAQALRAPMIRITGMVSAARRLVNLDQAPVLSIDGDDILLDERLLRAQFGLGSGT